MKPNITATQLGLPLLKGPIRFAIGPPDGFTSNSWKIWASKHGDVYIACRDNFNDVKVSLHTSGRWRMGFTNEAIDKDRRILPPDANRAWEVWNEPPESIPNTIEAFKLIFPTSELGVEPEQRQNRKWKNTLYIEEAPPEKITTISLFITKGFPILKHESEPSFCLASLDIGNDRRAQLIAHADPYNVFRDLIEEGVKNAIKNAESTGISIPEKAYVYLYGHRENGCRFLIGAKAKRT